MNQKFGPPPKNMMDEAERLIEPDVPGRDSDLLNTGKLIDQVNKIGQRELDSDEMDEEMMDEHLEDSQVVKPNWKITDGK